MKVVVADTSPLNYLVLIGQVDVLRRLYGKVLIPPEVLDELNNSGAPFRSDGVDSSTARVARRKDRIWRESDVLLLIDDAAGRAEANRRSIPNIGTLGVLKAAAVLQLLDLS